MTRAEVEARDAALALAAERGYDEITTDRFVSWVLEKGDRSAFALARRETLEEALRKALPECAIDVVSIGGECRGCGGTGCENGELQERPTVDLCAEGSVAPLPPGSCEVCERLEPENGRHPCRFEVGCSCWRGVPCDGSGRVKR